MKEELPIVIDGELGKLRGIIHKATIPCKGIVILLHGYFSSTKLGPVNLYVQIARLFAQQGYEFWRIDSFGVGDSDGDFIQSSFELRIKDYKTITELALQNNKNLAYLGHSMGTNFAIYLANCYADFVKRIFLLSPSFGNITWFDNLLNTNQQNQLYTEGIVERKGLTVTKEFIEYIFSDEIYLEIEKCKTKCIVFYATSDEFYNMQSIIKSVKYMSDFELFEIENSDHNFLSNRKLLIDIIKAKI